MPTPTPGAGRWPGRRGRRPLQRSAAAGTARPKCFVGAGLLRAAIKAAPTLGFRLRRAILRRLDVGAGAHTRPELAGGPEVRADVGVGPYRVCCGRHRPAKMLCRRGLSPPGGHKGRPYPGSVSGGLSCGA